MRRSWSIGLAPGTFASGVALTAAAAVLMLTACGTTSPTAAAADPSKPAAQDTIPALQGKQKQFCAAFQDSWKEQNDFDAKLTAVGDNPIARQTAEKGRPDLNKDLIAKELAAMGDGSFQDWVGALNLNVDGNRAFVTIQFPCPNTAPYLTAGLGGRMSFGNEWRNGFVPKPASAGIAIDSPLGQTLATFKQGDLVAASGSLGCGKNDGCYENFPSPAPWADFSATLTSIRALKGGH